ncbi:MAG TPA: glucosaminidase domain-containing protein [Acetobacteraceae bacterium]|jgi:flagellum-specific peptidoglycan hydrolase FlgJ
MAAKYQNDFVDRYAPLASQIATDTGLDPSVVLGHMALESSWGRNLNGNNLFGVNGPDGKKASYPDTQTAANAYTDLINGRYQMAAAYPDPSLQAQTIASLGYNTNKNYGPTLADTASTVRDVMAQRAALSPDNLLDTSSASQPNALASYSRL